MATTNKDLAQPIVNSTNWDVPINANTAVIDAALGGNTTKSVTGVGITPVVLTASEYQKLVLTFSGTLTANVTYHIPSGVGGQWIVRNATSGAFTVTIGNVAAGTSFVAPQGSVRTVYSDGTNIRAADDIVGTIPNASVAYASGGVLTGSSGLTYDGTRLAVTATTASTDTATEALRLDSQSSGTPAVGIGTTMSFATETAAGNTEVGMQISAVTTDVASGSEDFDFILRLMAGGAAASQVLKVSSTGTAFLNAIVDAAGGNTATINGVTPALSSQVQAEAGTDNTTQMTPLRVAEAIAAFSLGTDQTWQSPTRAVSTTYQNTTGKPIFISLAFNGRSGQIFSGETSPVSLLIAGPTGFAAGDGNARYSLMAIIPNNWFYRAEGNLNMWAELR
jgi:hypothetical protein